MTSIPTLEDIKLAAEKIRPYVRRTPVFTSQTFNNWTGSKIFFKTENFQKGGAFKFRGACNTVLSLTDEEKKMGVTTHSSGNHAQALALVSKMVGIKAYIVMPSNAPKVKKYAVLGYGAEVIECEPTLQAREANVKKIIAEKGSVLVHPYNDYRIIAGQATCAMEFIEEIRDLEIMVAPVGGGGLLAGTSLTCNYISDKIDVFAGEPEGANDAFLSLQKGEIVPSLNPDTIADGLLTSLGDKTFPIIQKHVTEIITVSDNEILDAMKKVWERMKIIIEPSSAVPVAAVLKNPDKFTGKNVGIILSGGNVDLENIRF
ncbi:MAG TPA: pyridoxal-phosphate dependent enzyme [Cyclobacteriaceae bacterium]|jgi:threonine dehydratase